MSGGTSRSFLNYEYLQSTWMHGNTALWGGWWWWKCRGDHIPSLNETYSYGGRDVSGRVLHLNSSIIIITILHALFSCVVHISCMLSSDTPSHYRDPHFAFLPSRKRPRAPPRTTLVLCNLYSAIDHLRRHPLRGTSFARRVFHSFNTHCAVPRSLS